MLTRRRVSPITEFDPVTNDTLCNIKDINDVFVIIFNFQTDWRLLLQISQLEKKVQCPSISSTYYAL